MNPEVFNAMICNLASPVARSLESGAWKCDCCSGGFRSFEFNQYAGSVDGTLPANSTSGLYHFCHQCLLERKRIYQFFLQHPELNRGILPNGKFGLPLTPSGQYAYWTWLENAVDQTLRISPLDASRLREELETQFGDQVKDGKVLSWDAPSTH